MVGFVYWMDLLGVAVFAATGALVASRKQMDIVGFALMASVTGIGGGTLRDLLLDRPVFWIGDTSYLLVCLGVALLLFLTAHLVQRRFIALLWADALGLAAFCVLGAELARRAGADPLIAVVMGMMTATFGGLIRDVLCQELPLILRKEVYASAAAAGAIVHVAGTEALGLSVLVSASAGLASAFALRAAGIAFGLSLPPYKPREARDYPP
ncbi:MAG: trimeric intracellular cation channel family protein [Limibacillus sp.]